MGNKSSSPSKSPDVKASDMEEEFSINDIAEGAQIPSAEMLASLQTLGEANDYTLLPQSLHQIAEAYSLKEDYKWAIQFLQLEKLYHQRLLTNLAALQENWESRWKERSGESGEGTDLVGGEHIEMLKDICKTHLRPSLTLSQNKEDVTGSNNHIRRADQHEVSEEDRQAAEERRQGLNSESQLSAQQEVSAGEVHEEGREAEEEAEEEPCEETPEEEVVNVEWPAGVPQASEKELAKLSHKEGLSSPDGLVSILKHRRASLDGLPPPEEASRHNSKRKVRFSEPEDAMDQEEVSGNSCLILLLLCLATVVVSVGGTALYCTLAVTYSNICSDFSHNVDFYMTHVRRVLDGVRAWLPLWSG